MFIIILGIISILFILWCMLKAASMADNNFEHVNSDFKISKKQ